ncbi:MAG: hypothetical protein HYW49_13700 [Deltaproteobacteria bacterium]|nr:hypothetical protein [Deltaproteobacteria bacterium]
MRLSLFLILFIAPWSILAIQSCGQGYKGLHSENGRRAIIEEANNLLTSGQCEAAIAVLKPLYESEFNNNEVRLTYASAFACAGGFNFAMLIGSIQNVGSDIWSPIVASNYSPNYSNGRVTSLNTAARIIRETSRTPGSFKAIDRDPDVNLYMIFIQAELITTTISIDTMGVADEKTGKKTTTITGKGGSAEQCRIELAVATIQDCLGQVSTGSAIDKVSTSISAICGGACPTNLDPGVCTATEIVQGTALIAAIDTQWTLF